MNYFHHLMEVRFEKSSTSTGYLPIFPPPPHHFQMCVCVCVMTAVWPKYKKLSSCVAVLCGLFQLTYDYKFDFEDDQHKIPCLCGATFCRKWMN